MEKANSPPDIRDDDGSRIQQSTDPVGTPKTMGAIGDWWRDALTVPHGFLSPPSELFKASIVREPLPCWMLLPWFDERQEFKVLRLGKGMPVDEGLASEAH